MSSLSSLARIAAGLITLAVTTTSCSAAAAATSPLRNIPNPFTGDTDATATVAPVTPLSAACPLPALTTPPAQSFTPTHIGPAASRPEDQARLDALVVCSRVQRVHGTVPGYKRDLFGPPWKDVDGNGCRQRPDVLWRDLDRTRPYTLTPGHCPHTVATGSWIDPYSGEPLTASTPGELSTLIQIDHRVALQEAFASGADRWTPAQRLAFANWLPNLVPTSAGRNSSKGDGDAAAMRLKKDYQCTFAQSIIDTKTLWHLSVDTAEKKALSDLLTTCRPTP